MSIRKSKIGEWTEAQLGRFIQQVLHASPASLPPSLTLENVTANKRLIVRDRMELSPQAIAYLKDALGLP